LSEAKEIVRVLLEAVAQRDTETLARLVQSDVVWWAPVSAARHGLPRPLVGSEAVVTLLSGAHGFFRADTTTWTVLRLVEEDETVVAHVERRCLTAGGIPYENEYLLRFDMADGRIAQVWEHTDTAFANDLLARALDPQQRSRLIL
jgi:ketosteroid isomerase-like protein